MLLAVVFSVHEVVMLLVVMLAFVSTLLWSLTRKVVVNKSFVVRSVMEKRKRSGEVSFIIKVSPIMTEEDASLPFVNDSNSTFEIYVSHRPSVEPGDIISLPL